MGGMRAGAHDGRNSDIQKQGQQPNEMLSTSDGW